MLPPLIAVAPEERLAAETVPPNVVVFELVNAIAPTAVPLPILPEKLIAPAPELIVMSCAELFEIEEVKLTELSVVASTAFAPSVAAPYDCAPLLVTLPLLNVTAPVFNVVSPEITPFNIDEPLNAKLCVPPVTLLNVMLEPVNVVSAPSVATSKDCAPDVVTLPPLIAVVPVVVTVERPESVLLKVVIPLPDVLVANVFVPPAMVFWKLILPVVLEKVLAPESVTGPVRVNAFAPEVEILPLALIEDD